MSNLGSDDKIAFEVIRRPAAEWLPEQYLPFTFYAIRSRALVADDGLKPVNRRIIWSMFQKGITHTSKHLKAARAAADAVAYHPHGSASVEDALARMAQKFSLRIPLIDPYGSVGIVTGDTAASARYWEARLSREAMELVREVSEGAVELGKNFDGELDEPTELPVRWPVAIINGTQGIAVGYASNMFSHNPDEVMEAARKVLKNTNMTVGQLLKVMPGPDMPTGGELFEIDGVREYYETGSGRFTIRGRYTIENMARGKVRVIFYELPYQVGAGDIMQKIRDLQSAGKFKEIASVKDLTDKKNGLRLAIETKSGTNHLSVLNALFKATNLESKFSVNSTVLIDNSPIQTSMLDLLRNFIEFRKACITRKAETRITKIERRLTQLEAILAVLIDIDKAISIIRKSETADDARQGLIDGFSNKKFVMTEDQADYILAMQLRRLTKQDSVAIANEKNELGNEKTALSLILNSEEKLIEAVDKDLVDTKKIISSKRRTIISGVTSDELKESQKEMAQAARDVDKNLPCVITRFVDGRLLKSDDAFTYKSGEKKYSNSPIIEQIKMKTQDSIVLIGSDGIGRRIPLSYLTIGIVSRPEAAGVQLPKGVRLIGISKTESMKSDVGLVIATKNGGIKIAKTDFPKSDTFPVVLLEGGDEALAARWIGKTLSGTWFSMTSRAGNMLVFQASTIRVSGAKSGTVRGMKLKDVNDTVIGFDWIQSNRDPAIMVISKSEKTIKLTSITSIPTKNKGGMGVALHGFTKDENSLSEAYVGKNIIVALDELNNAVALPPLSKRAAKGTDFAPKISFGSSAVTPL